MGVVQRFYAKEEAGCKDKKLHISCEEIDYIGQSYRIPHLRALLVRMEILVENN